MVSVSVALKMTASWYFQISRSIIFLKTEHQLPATCWVTGQVCNKTATWKYSLSYKSIVVVEWSVPSTTSRSSSWAVSKREGLHSSDSLAGWANPSLHFFRWSFSVSEQWRVRPGWLHSTCGVFRRQCGSVLNIPSMLVVWDWLAHWPRVPC